MSPSEPTPNTTGAQLTVKLASSEVVRRMKALEQPATPPYLLCSRVTDEGTNSSTHVPFASTISFVAGA